MTDATSLGWPIQLHNIQLLLNSRHLLHNLNATLNPCGCTVILGANGAGKTALMRILHGLQPPTSGKILWGESTNPHTCNQAYVPAGAKPFHRSVRDNILLALRLKQSTGKAAQQLADEALEMCQLAHLAHHPAQRLSSGETQKLFLARAWALRATTLFLDEPTANLDPASTASVEALIQNHQQNGMNVILVTHNIAQARRLAHEVVLLDQGEWREQASADSFFDNPQTAASQAYLAGLLR